MGIIRNISATTHIANGYDEPLLAFVDNKVLDVRKLSNRMQKRSDNRISSTDEGSGPLWDDNHRFIAEGYEAMHELFVVLMKEYNFKKIFPQDHVAFNVTVDRGDKVYITVWNRSLGFIWKNRPKPNDYSYIVKNDGVIVRAKYGTLWTNKKGILLGR